MTRHVLRVARMLRQWTRLIPRCSRPMLGDACTRRDSLSELRCLAHCRRGCPRGPEGPAPHPEHGLPPSSRGRPHPPGRRGPPPTSLPKAGEGGPSRRRRPARASRPKLLVASMADTTHLQLPLGSSKRQVYRIGPSCIVTERQYCAPDDIVTTCLKVEGVFRVS